jgi:hypothetical protein
MMGSPETYAVVDKNGLKTSRSEAQIPENATSRQGALRTVKGAKIGNLRREEKREKTKAGMQCSRWSQNMDWNHPTRVYVATLRYCC